MNTTREQRRAFIKNAKKQVKEGTMSKVEFATLKKQIADMGTQQGNNTQQIVLESKGDRIISTDIETEIVEDDFTPDDL